MSVMVGEMHTDMVQDGPTGPGSAHEQTARPPGVADEYWREAKRRAEYLARRVRAENFDD
jgi:hypothetical protein